ASRRTNPSRRRAPSNAMTGSLLTASEVAELLGVPKSWVYEQSRTGRIPTVTLGRYRRYRREAIEAWVTQLEAPARGARAFASTR
ncbi:MAG: helix-turn-helix domain-containing protein, partial [Actinomycetota bacterium]|nr:helix-turn-helix domain-containing protein [Actinomycetota bacterium]